MRAGFAGLAPVALLIGAVTIGGSAGAQPQQAATPTPAADCGPGSDPETAEQGRVPQADYDSGRVEQPYTCNTEVVAHVDGTGGFKVHRYTDPSGTDCAYYDTNLVLGNDLFTQAQTQGAGVAVLDMTDATSPVQTDSLVTPAMLSPHESLALNAERGLLVAVMGTAVTLPGIVDVYDVATDCTQPQLLASTPIGVLGHESGFSPDGLTYYASSTALSTIAAIDLTDPTMPTLLTLANLNSHGMNVSDDGNRLYLTPIDVGSQVLPADGDLGAGLVIADVSSIQAREPGASIEVITEFVWPDSTIAQTAIPVTIGGSPYLLTIDEFVDFDDFGAPLSAPPGIARILDISDETDPSVVSTIDLEVHRQPLRESLGGDPGASSASQGYAGHYCAVPQREEPGIMACSFILSGLRVFDITDPTAPREIAYFNAGLGNPSPANTAGAPYAMSAPAFVPERNEIWYSDVASGFWNIRVTNGAWNPAQTAPGPDPIGSPSATSPAPAVTDAGSESALPATGASDASRIAAAGAMMAMGLVLFSRRRRRKS